MSRKKKVNKSPETPAGPPPRFIVVAGETGGFWVRRAETGQNVDGPFRDREDAEARAAKREIRDQ